MTAGLDPDLAAAYVRELSADVIAVLVLDARGERLAGPQALTAPARRLAERLDGGAASTPAGTVVVARGPEHTLIAVAGPGSGAGPTLLDAAAAVGAEPGEPVANPDGDLKTALEHVLAAAQDGQKARSLRR